MVHIATVTTRGRKSYLEALDGTPQTWDNEAAAQQEIDNLKMTGQGYGIPRKQEPATFKYVIEPVKT